MLKLVKLCYIAHGWVLGLTGKPLIEEDVEAWQYGPVIPSLYHEFKHFRSDPITTLARELSLETFTFETPEIPLSDTGTIEILDKAWGVYRDITGGRLINQTHQEGTPWKKNYVEGRRNVVIPNSEIEDYYRTFLQKLVA